MKKSVDFPGGYGWTGKILHRCMAGMGLRVNHVFVFV